MKGLVLLLGAKRKRSRWSVHYHCCFGSPSTGSSWDPCPRQPDGAFPTVVARTQWGAKLELKGHESPVTNTCSAIVSEAPPPCRGAGLAVASGLAWPLPHTNPSTLIRLSRTFTWRSGAIHLYVPNSAALIQHQCSQLWTLPHSQGDFPSLHRGGGWWAI